jgi:hypothetical protein
VKARVDPGAWEVEPPRRRAALARAAAVPLAYALAALASAWPARWHPLTALLLMPLLALTWRYVVGHGRALARLGAVEVTGEAEPRLGHLVTALAGDLGLGRVRAFVIEGGPPNAAACWAGGPAVAVSRALLETLTRTELEAAVAHCLVRAAGPGFAAARLATALGPLGRVAGVVVDHRDDVRACAVTRYPPGLAGALGAAAPRRELAPLWFAGDGPFHEPQAARLAVIADL